MFLLRPPDLLLRRERFFERKNVCDSEENGVRTRCAAIVNRYAIVNLLRRANLLWRSIFSTAGSLWDYLQREYLNFCNSTLPYGGRGAEAAIEEHSAG